MPSGREVLLACTDGKALLSDTGNGKTVAQFSLGTDLSDAFGVRFSPDGNLAAIIGRSGYDVIDIAMHRLIASGDEYGDRELGAEPRDATFLGSEHSLLIMRADEGLTRLNLQPWRFLDGAALLRATTAAIPRSWKAGETGAITAKR